MFLCAFYYIQFREYWPVFIPYPLFSDSSESSLSSSGIWKQMFFGTILEFWCFEKSIYLFQCQQKEQVDCRLSLKPTGLGFGFDHCKARILPVLIHFKHHLFLSDHPEGISLNDFFIHFQMCRLFTSLASLAGRKPPPFIYIWRNLPDLVFPQVLFLQRERGRKGKAEIIKMSVLLPLVFHILKKQNVRWSTHDLMDVISLKIVR